MVQPIDSVLDDILKHSIRGKTNQTNPLTSSKTIDKAAQRNTHSSPSLGDMYLTSQGYTQAIVKISSYGKGQSKVRNHLSYISRKGELDLEDQDGALVSGMEAQETLVNEWAADFGDNIRSRDTVHSRP